MGRCCATCRATPAILVMIITCVCFAGVGDSAEVPDRHVLISLQVVHSGQPDRPEGLQREQTV